MRQNKGFTLVELVASMTLFLLIGGSLVQVHQFLNASRQETMDAMILEYEIAYLDDVLRAFSPPSVSAGTAFYVTSGSGTLGFTLSPESAKTSGGFLRTEDGSLSHRITALTAETASGSVNTYSVSAWITARENISKTAYTVR